MDFCACVVRKERGFDPDSGGSGVYQDEVRGSISKIVENLKSTIFLYFCLCTCNYISM